MMSPQWSEYAMWWHAYPLGFLDAPIRESREDRVHHRLPVFEDWLDHILGLGLNGLALGPIFESTSHGYDTLDHFAIDSRIGDETDFTRLASAAHQNGIRVLLDGVFNHVGRDHPWFVDVERRGPASPHASSFLIDWTGWASGDPIRAQVFEGHDSLVTLNHDSPAVARYVVDVMIHWMERGADGWRLDAAYAVPTSFWARVLPQVRERFPDAWFSGEVIHGADPQLATNSSMDSLTQYELWQGIWHAISDANLYELSHAIERHNRLLPSYAPSTFLGNHDVTRIASAVGPNHVGHALAVLLTVAGVPFIYAGDEYGWLGVKEQRLGGDDAVRPPFPAHPPLADGSGTDSRVLHHHRELIALRRRHPWLHHARSSVVSVTNETIVFESQHGNDRLMTALNLSTTDLRVSDPADDISVEAGIAVPYPGGFSLAPDSWTVVSIPTTRRSSSEQ